jgi:uncharacterized heparinase superfamily protein
MATKPSLTSRIEILSGAISKQVEKIGLYWHTIRHLRPSQLFARARFRFAKPRLAQIRADIARRRGEWTRPIDRAVSLVGSDQFTFLNSTHHLDEIGWDNPAIDKLWRYNLHYFDDLSAKDATSRSAAHRVLIERWISENPGPHGSGWEPYPTSLRIVNWIKWILAGNPPTSTMLSSLATQTDWLTKRLEHHLLGNHLFVNAKALIFSGLFFDGADAGRWLSQGFNILQKEIGEQILADGGHFELSPMYHALILEDILDTYNICRAYSHRLHVPFPVQQELASRMLHWLSIMTHPDGEIAFFNDAAFGIAPTLAELTEYAESLSIPTPRVLTDDVTYLPESGFIRVQQGRIIAILDVGEVGASYQPGHAHADTLSFELSIDNVRVFVNSGTSEYGISPERSRQRGTAAHNAVVIDDCDSSEVWGGFRVARRAEPTGLSLQRSGYDVEITCSHDGYRRLPGRVLHTRHWHFASDCLAITDEFTGQVNSAIARLHTSPSVHFRPCQGDEFTGKIGDRLVRVAFSAPTTPNVEGSTWHPQFGRSLPNQCFSASSNGPRITTYIHW